MRILDHVAAWLVVSVLLAGVVGLSVAIGRPHLPSEEELMRAVLGVSHLPEAPAPRLPAVKLHRRSAMLDLVD